MNEKSRKLVIHTGANKTGSSALQAYFLANQTRLAEHKIGYAHPPQVSRPDEITSGNGLPLFSALQNANAPSQLVDILESYCGKNPISLCSSEMFVNLNLDKLKILWLASNDISIDLEFVVFVRDVESFSASSYNQVVKRLGESRSYADYINATPNNYFHIQHLRILVEVFGLAAVRVISYEDSKDTLDLAFWGCLALPHVHFDRTILTRKINRSLVSCELDLLREINKRFGPQYSQEMSDYLIYLRPNLHEFGGFDNSVLPYLKKLYQADLDWVNAQFFSDRKVIDLKAKNLLKKIFLSKKITSEIIFDAIGWFAERLAVQTARNNSLSPEIVACMRWFCGTLDYKIAPLFDGNYYLDVYPDVAASTVDPLTHFLEYGLFEGRYPSADILSFLMGASQMCERHFQDSLHKVEESFREELAQVQQHENLQLTHLPQLNSEHNRDTLELASEYARNEHVLIQAVTTKKDELNKSLLHISNEITRFAASDVQLIALLEHVRCQVADLTIKDSFILLEKNITNNLAINSEQSLSFLENIRKQHPDLNTQLREVSEMVSTQMALIKAQVSSALAAVELLQKENGRQANLQFKHASNMEVFLNSQAFQENQHRQELLAEMKVFNAELVRMNSSHHLAQQSYESKLAFVVAELDSVKASLGWRITNVFRAMWRSP